MKRNILPFFAAIIVCSIILIIDLFMPRGYLEWLLYIIPILMINNLRNSFLTIILLFLIAVFLTVGFFLSPDIGTPFLVSVTNRIEGFLTFTIFTILVNRLTTVKIKIEKANTLLEARSRELAETIKELESFTYSISHDLRSPIAIIKGFAGFLIKDYSDLLDDTGREHLKIIDNTAEKMNTLINELLRLSRVSQHPLHLEQINLSNQAESILIELHKLYGEINFNANINKGLTACADKQLIRIALDNLLSNAVKYSSRKENPVIEMGQIKKDNKDIFFIRDNGAGFDMKKAGKLFQPFFRLHTEKEYSGTGIGLSIVYRIIMRHGGKIWAESEIGRGTTFYFTLPDCRL